MYSKTLEEKWFILEEPYIETKEAGLAIVSGNPDPNIGKLLFDISWFETLPQEKDVSKKNLENMRKIIAHIVKLHNDYLDDLMFMDIF